MGNPEKIYEAFGELIYVVATADGEIQDSEMKVIKNELADYEYGEQVLWSFNYELEKKNSVEDTYKKVITCCEAHGPEKEYQYLINLLEKMTKASSGVDDNESNAISGFRADLIERFRAATDKINQHRLNADN